METGQRAGLLRVILGNSAFKGIPIKIPQKFFNRRGFTLLEILIVMVIVAMIATIGIPKFLASVDRAETRAAASKIAAAMRNARIFAITEKLPFTLVVDKENRRVFTKRGNFDPAQNPDAMTPAVELPQSVEIWSTTGKYLTVRFGPRGTSTGGELFVTPKGSKSAYDRRGYAVRLNPLSGKAKVVPNRETKRKRL